MLRMLSAVCLAIVILAAYWPGLSGDFVFDDYWNLVQNKQFTQCEASVDSARQASFSSESGRLRRPVSMFSFWLNYCASGTDPFTFKLTNIAIHAGNALLVWLLAFQLLRLSARRLDTPPDKRYLLFAALGIAAVWALTPIQLSAVLYVVQRMASLATTFALLGCAVYLAGRMRIAYRPGYGATLMVLGIGCVIPAVLSKENGILLLPLIGWIELILVGGKGNRINRLVHRSWIFLFIAGGLIVLAAVVRDPDGILGGFGNRDFTRGERLLTQARVVWWYAVSTFIPNLETLGLYHDDTVISTGLLSPAKTFAAMVGWIAAFFVALGCLRFSRLPLFGLGWFAIGHSLESTAIPLELVYEHRNYLPNFGLIFMFGALIALHAKQHWRIVAALALLYIAMLSGVTALRAHTWGDPVRFGLAQVQRHPESPRAHIDVAQALLGRSHLIEDDLTQQALRISAHIHLQRSADLDTDSISPHYLLLRMASEEGAPDQTLVSQVQQRLGGGPFRGSKITALRSITQDTIDGKIVLSEEQIKSLYEAALAHDDLSPRLKSRIYFAYANYLAQAEQDYQGAASLAIAAAVNSPQDPDIRTALAEYALALGDITYAVAQARCAQKFDTLGVFRKSTDGILAKAEPTIAKKSVTMPTEANCKDPRKP